LKFEDLKQVTKLPKEPIVNLLKLVEIYYAVDEFLRNLFPVGNKWLNV